jgi:hypothetical protein
MSVSFKIDESVLDYGDESIIQVNGNTVGECFNIILQQKPSVKKALFDEKGNLYPRTYFKVNEESVISDPFTRSIKDGDKIELIVFRSCC